MQTRAFGRRARVGDEAEAPSPSLPLPRALRYDAFPPCPVLRDAENLPALPTMVKHHLEVLEHMGGGRARADSMIRKKATAILAAHAFESAGAARALGRAAAAAASADGLEPQTPERSGADPPAPALTRASSVRKTSTVKITPQCSGGKHDVFVHAEVEGRIVNLMPDEEWPADTLKV